MKKSKFVGMSFDNGWKCTDIYLAANYCHGTKHNAYRYQLARVTSDGKCDKVITVHGNTMTKIAKGVLDVEKVAVRKKKSDLKVNEILYKFN